MTEEAPDHISNPLEGFYLIDQDGMYLKPLTYLKLTSATYSYPSPSPIENLLSMYGLEPIAKKLARTKSDGSKGVKLRKSYKNHIQDLPGKHQIPDSKPLNGQLLDPEVAQQSDIIKELNSELLNVALKLDRTPINGIPGFVTADLAINDQHTLMRGDDMSDNDEHKKKRKKKAQNGNDMKRQHV